MHLSVRPAGDRGRWGTRRLWRINEGEGMVVAPVASRSASALVVCLGRIATAASIGVLRISGCARSVHGRRRHFHGVAHGRGSYVDRCGAALFISAHGRAGYRGRLGINDQSACGSCGGSRAARTGGACFGRDGMASGLLDADYRLCNREYGAMVRGRLRSTGIRALATGRREAIQEMAPPNNGMQLTKRDGGCAHEAFAACARRQ